jgi:phage repressor protein C with HTH and peptisase S24 domain
MNCYPAMMKKRSSIPWERVAARLDELGKDQLWLRATMEVEANVITNWKTRGVPSAKAVAIARTLGLSTDELLDPSLGLRDNSGAKESKALPQAGSGEITIPQFDTGGSMGTGVLLRDQPGEINGWRVTPDWLRKNVRSHSGAGNLAIVTGFGDSMRGMFNPGDPLLVDRGTKAFDGDAVYFFRVGEEGFIKRLQKIPGEGIIASSENKAYRDWTIKPDMDFEVLARVIKVWQSVDF